MRIHQAIILAICIVSSEKLRHLLILLVGLSLILVKDSEENELVWVEFNSQALLPGNLLVDHTYPLFLVKYEPDSFLLADHPDIGEDLYGHLVLFHLQLNDFGCSSPVAI